MVPVSLKRGEGPKSDHALPQTDHVAEFFHERDVLFRERRRRVVKRFDPIDSRIGDVLGDVLL